MSMTMTRAALCCDMLHAATGMHTCASTISISPWHPPCTRRRRAGCIMHKTVVHCMAAPRPSMRASTIPSHDSGSPRR